MSPFAAPVLPFPAIEPFATGWLDVGEGHRLYYEQCGNPQGFPLVFLHGGPGSGCSPRHRQLFDPARCHIVLFDQRGCGRSQPRGHLQANTSAPLVADIERLRLHLGLGPWLVVGGSWGAGLALAYAAAHRPACSGLILRAVFLGRASDLAWFFQHASQLLPDAWASLADQAPETSRGALLTWLSEGVLGADVQQALACALAWEAWENALAERRPVPVRARPETDEAQCALLDKYRVQSHYLRHGCFWTEAPLLGRTGALAGLPTAILHGRLDWVCRPEAAWELHRSMPGSRLLWLDGCGHSPFEPAMAQALSQAVLHHGTHGHFDTWADPEGSSGDTGYSD